MMHLFLVILCTISTLSVALRCYSTNHKEEPSIKECPLSQSSCNSVIDIDSGEIISSSCSSCHAKSRECELEDTNIPNIKTCCCKRKDECNRDYSGFIKLNEKLRLLPLPLSSVPPNPFNFLVCEYYKCNSSTFPDGFNHSYQICPKSNIKTAVCQSVYNCTNGYLIPVFKGCSNVKRGVSTNEECLINNPSILSKRNGTISCYCTGNICNQNETFTHLPKLATCDKAGINYWKYGGFVGIVIVGGVAAVPLGALGLAALGFTASGILKGSFAALLMSKLSPVVSGGIVSTLQSIGATGFGIVEKAVLTTFGTSLSAGLAVGMNFIFGSGNEEFDPCKCIITTE